MTEAKTETDPVFIALGSNLGDRHQQIARAVGLLDETDGFTVVEVAPVLESDPMYVTDQPAFLNTVLVGRSALEPEALLDRLKTIEAALGREKTYRNGPRMVDLDIVYFADAAYESARLTVPHPRRLERIFVLKPLADLAPDFVDPESGRRIADHLHDLTAADG